MVSQLFIGRHRVGGDAPTLVIAEIGVNHNGSVQTALDLVMAAARCGADCVKFQTFTAERVATLGAPKAGYQQRTTSPSQTQFEMLHALELSRGAHQEILKACDEHSMTFLSTPYSVADAEMLFDLGVPAIKIASGQIVELDFLSTVAGFGVPMLVSTGMSTLAEVERAVDVIRRAGNDRIVLLQCTTEYPSPVADANLRAMITMASTFGCLVGYSDHTTSETAAVAAVALGACVVEKHFTLDRHQPGPDHLASADPGELREFVRSVREARSALGSSQKQPSEAELANLPRMRRSLVAAREIPAGTRLTKDLLVSKRPGIGISPSSLGEVIGRVVRVDLAKDHLLDWSDLAE